MYTHRIRTNTADCRAHSARAHHHNRIEINEPEMKYASESTTTASETIGFIKVSIKFDRLTVVFSSIVFTCDS